MTRAVAAVPVYLSCNQVDTTYHLRRGTARATARAGVIKCAVRQWGDREKYLIRLEDAERKWGAK